MVSKVYSQQTYVAYPIPLFGNSICKADARHASVCHFIIL